MSNVAEIISSLKADWGQPRAAIHRGRTCPFLLACSFDNGLVDGLEQLPFSIPEDVREFWMTAQSATLFKDRLYGQWGVEVLTPAQAVSETSKQISNRPRDFTNSDLVFSRFFGDSDLVVLECNPQRPGFGSVTIALPLDKRSDWPVVAGSLREFLEKLVEAQGDKYWELPPGVAPMAGFSVF